MEDADSSCKRTSRAHYVKLTLLTTLVLLVGLSLSPGYITNGEPSPSVNITSPANGGVINDNTPQLSYKITGGSNNLVYVTVDGKPVNIRSGSNLDKLPDGRHNVTVDVTDDSGNKETSQASFTVDTKPPVVDISYPVNGGATNGTHAMAYSMDGTGSQIKSIEVRIDGALSNKRAGDKLGLGDGRHGLTVDVSDEAGNHAAAQSSFTVDNVDPTVSISSPADGSTVGKSSKLNYSVDGTGSNVAMVAVFVDGKAIGTRNRGTLSLSNGTHSVTVVSVDAAVNSGVSQSIFTVGHASTAKANSPSRMKSLEVGEKGKPTKGKSRGSKKSSKGGSSKRKKK